MSSNHSTVFSVFLATMSEKSICVQSEPSTFGNPVLKYICHGSSLKSVAPVTLIISLRLSKLSESMLYWRNPVVQGVTSFAAGCHFVIVLLWIL